MSLSIVFICLVLVVGIYFYNNPLKHGPWFLSRRFINWFPLGMTYAFLYMGRYNLTVAKNALGSLMSNEDFGLIFAAGTITYAFSFLINGPLVDKIGGKKGILIAALGAAAANVALGVITWLVLTNRIHVRLLPIFSVTYALNMYFQSYGAVSIIKVKAHWFHVRERGVFGAIFGTLISFGVYFAFDWGQAIIDITKPNAPMPTSAVERVLRNGIMQWYTIFGHDVKQPGAEVILANWGLLLCVFGIVGGFAGGLISDKFFQSRRGPPAVIFCAFMLMMTAVMAMNLFSFPFVVGVAALLIVAAVTGVHSLMSGTAAADFGGRKATATASGIVDGFVYLGSGVQSVGVGYLVTHYSWQWWPIFLMPFALIGGLVAWRIWHELPAATRVYIETVERQHLVIATTNEDAEHVSQTLKS